MCAPVRRSVELPGYESVCALAFEYVLINTENLEKTRQNINRLSTSCTPHQLYANCRRSQITTNTPLTQRYKPARRVHTAAGLQGRETGEKTRKRDIKCTPTVLHHTMWKRWAVILPISGRSLLPTRKALFDGWRSGLVHTHREMMCRILKQGTNAWCWTGEDFVCLVSCASAYGVLRERESSG